MSCHSIGSCKRKLVTPARHWRAGHQRPCEFRPVGELTRFVWSWGPSESSCTLSHGSDDRRHRHPATDGQHGQPAGDRVPTVRKVLEELLAVLDANSPDGVI